jgi:hypothetical protein
MTAVAHRAPYRRRTQPAAITGIYELTPHVGHAATELVTWLQAHALPRGRVPDNARLVVGGGRLNIDYFVSNGTDTPVRGRLLLPLLDHLPIPSAFRLIDHTKDHA